MSSKNILSMIIFIFIIQQTVSKRMICGHTSPVKIKPNCTNGIPLEIILVEKYNEDYTLISACDKAYLVPKNPSEEMKEYTLHDDNYIKYESACKVLRDEETNRTLVLYASVGSEDKASFVDENFTEIHYEMKNAQNNKRSRCHLEYSTLNKEVVWSFLYSNNPVQYEGQSLVTNNYKVF